MLRGILVVNQFMQIEKFQELYQRLISASKEQDITLRLMTNVECYQYLAKMKDYNFVLFWDKDVNLARLLEQLNIRCFNNSKSIATCDSKVKTYIELLPANINMPKTIPIPFSYEKIDWNTNNFVDYIIKELGLPLIVKESYGSFGEQVHLINDKSDVIDVLNKISPKEALCQQFISSSKGEDIRIQMVGNKAVAAMKRTAKAGDFRSNLTNGGSAIPYNPSNLDIEAAIKIINVLQLDFAGIDFMHDSSGYPILCEVNSNAHFVNLEKITDTDVASNIISYIRKEFLRKNHNA